MSLSHAPAALQVSTASDGIAVGQLGPVCIVIWRGEVTHARFQKQRMGLTSTVEESGGNGGFLCVIEPTAGAPDSDLRKASADLINGLGDRLKCVACVVEGTGFKAAVGRSVLAGMSMLSGRRKTPFEVTAEVDKAEEWMRRQITIPPVSLTRATEELRRALNEADSKQS